MNFYVKIPISILLTLFIFFIYWSHSNSKDDYSKLSNCGYLLNLVPESWKTDSLGCNSEREEFALVLDTLDLTRFSFDCILQAFGKPNSTFEHEMEYIIWQRCNSNPIGDRRWLVLVFDGSKILRTSIMVE